MECLGESAKYMCTKLHTIFSPIHFVHIFVVSKGTHYESKNGDASWMHEPNPLDWEMWISNFLSFHGFLFQPSLANQSMGNCLSGNIIVSLSSFQEEKMDEYNLTLIQMTANRCMNFKTANSKISLKISHYTFVFIVTLGKLLLTSIEQIQAKKLPEE